MSTTYYVSGQGSDQNNGLSRSTAFVTLQKAADQTRPGDVVMVLNGTYGNVDPNQNILTITTSGTPDQWITYQSFPGHRPKLISQNWHGISVEGAAYIVIDGFNIQGNQAQVSLEDAIAQQDNLDNPLTSGNGIGVSPGESETGEPTYSHHIVIRNNTVHETSGGGIYTVNADHITIEGNTTYNNARYSPYATSGISIYQSWNSELPLADQASGVSSDYQMVIRNNISYGNENLIPFYQVGSITDGNGIIVDDHRHTQDSPLEPYRGRTLVEGNVVYENGGRGIHVFESDRVDIRHNTTYQNSQHPDIGDGEITAIFAADVTVENNILYGVANEQITTLSGTQQVTFQDNLLFNGNLPGGDRPSSNDFSSDLNLATPNIVDQDPQFFAPDVYDFRLRSTSPVAVGAFGADLSPDLSPESHQVGTPKRDRLSGQTSDDVLEGLNGPDRLLGHDGNDVLLGGRQGDRLVGGNGKDILYGDGGNDRLRGQAGADWLVGGPGSDRLHGGKQADTFVLQSGSGVDRILDFGRGRDRFALTSDLTVENLTVIERRRGVLLKSGQDKLAWILGAVTEDISNALSNAIIPNNLSD